MNIRIFSGQFPYSVTVSVPSERAYGVLRPLVGREGEAWGPGAGGAPEVGKEAVCRAGGMECSWSPPQGLCLERRNGRSWLSLGGGVRA